jgi:N-acetylneuraminate synthase
MKKFFDYNIDVGWSDHTAMPGVIYSAVANGARIIEFHLDLNGRGYEFQHGHCWLPGQIAEVIKNVRHWEASNIPIGISAKKLLDARQQRTDPNDGMRPLKKFR